MHSHAVLFSCGNAGCSDCGYGGSQSCTDFLCGISELAQLSVSILAGFVGFLDGVGDVLGFISGFVNAFVGFFRSGSVGTKVTLDAVQSRLRIVQLYLPALGAAVVLTKGLGGIGKGRTERFVFLFLLVAISLFRTSQREVRTSVDLSFLSNCEATGYISEPMTLKELFISARDFLNSRSPSRPILSRNSRTFCVTSLKMGIKKEPCGSGI